MAGSYDTPGFANGAYISGDYAYIPDDEAGGLQIIDISNPKKPIFVGSYDTPGEARGVYTSGGYAYVADGVSGLQIIDINDPTKPTFASSYKNLDFGFAQGVYISGNYAHVSYHGHNSHVIDISDPKAPTLADSSYTPSFTAQEVVSAPRRYTYTTNGIGLQIIKINSPVTNIKVVDSNTITATFPSDLPEGPYNILVTNPGGQSEKGYLYNGFSETTTVNPDQPARYRFIINLTGKGSVTGLGINCPGDCDEIIEDKGEITLTATADTDSQFNSWSGNLSGNANPLTFTMDSDKDITATFTTILPIDITGKVTLFGEDNTVSDLLLTLSNLTDSPVTANPDASGSYAFNDLAKGDYTLRPALPGYHFYPPVFLYPELAASKNNQDIEGLNETYDSDNDNLPDWWEYNDFGNKELGQSAEGNPDNDDWTNIEEYKEGNDPNNASPKIPGLISPEDQALDTDITPTLEGSEYSDIEKDIHKATHWQISRVQFNEPDFTSTDLVFDQTDNKNKVQLKIGSGILMPDTTYYVRLNHSDPNGKSRWSGFADGVDSPGSSFTTASDINDADRNGMPDDQQIDNLVDLDNDGTDDNSQPDIAALTSAVSQVSVALKTSSGEITFAETEDSNNLPDKPADYDFADGVFNFRIEGLTTGQEVEVTFYLSEIFSDTDKWYKYSESIGWFDYTDNIVDGIGTDRITLKFKDGGIGDADGVANAMIVDPGGPGYKTVNNTTPTGDKEKSPDNNDPTAGGTPAATTDNGNDNGKGGVCFVQTVLNSENQNNLGGYLFLIVTLGLLGFISTRKRES